MKKAKKILFLLNPISGIGKKSTVPDLIEKHLSGEGFEVSLMRTEYRSHGHELAKELHDQYDSIVAIGGDGSVNEIGSALLGSNCALGIIPTGSGNGLARHLKIPLKVEAAILRIKSFQERLIDTGTVNDRIFIGIAGFGFDAHIAKRFDEHPSRGFRTYAQLVVGEYRKYQLSTFQFQIGDRSWERKLLMCTVANSCQYGNGFIISPKSKIDDGVFEIIQIDKFSLLSAPFVVQRFFSGKIDRSKYYHDAVQQENLIIRVKDQEEIHFHLDGEPFTGGPEFTVCINPLSLKVI